MRNNERNEKLHRSFDLIEDEFIVEAVIELAVIGHGRIHNPDTIIISEFTKETSAYIIAPHFPDSVSPRNVFRLDGEMILLFHR